MNNEKTLNKHLQILIYVLFFGGLWGILEATLGTLLHMPFIPGKVFLASSTIMVPIAYFLMGACYKKTGTLRSVMYMGLLAAGIKTISCLIFNMSFNPVYYILLESVFMGVALLVIRPKQIISFTGLGTMILANTLYLGISTFIRVDVINSTPSMFLANFEQYILTINCVAILYTFVTGALIYGGMKLVEKHSWDFSKIEKVIYHPAFASGVAAVALVLTIVIR